MLDQCLRDNLPMLAIHIPKKTIYYMPNYASFTTIEAEVSTTTVDQ